jgi:hypothetical protein
MFTDATREENDLARVEPGHQPELALNYILKNIVPKHI